MPFLKTSIYNKGQRTRDMENLALRQGWNGPITNDSNEKYLGEWKDNYKDGYGISKTRSGRLYDGIWKAGSGFQKGISCSEQEGVYEIDYRGEWENGKQNGQGEKHYKDGSLYKGNFKNSKREQNGKMWYADGSFYCGYWVNNLRNGEGMFIAPNGDRYEGTWMDDVKHGQGRYFMINSGRCFDGVWKKGICITSTVADIPFKESAANPKPYPIKEVGLADEAFVSADMKENAMLYLDVDLSKVDCTPFPLTKSNYNSVQGTSSAYPYYSTAISASQYVRF